MRYVLEKSKCKQSGGQDFYNFNSYTKEYDGEEIPEILELSNNSCIVNTKYPTDIINTNKYEYLELTPLGQSGQYESKPYPINDSQKPTNIFYAYYAYLYPALPAISTNDKYMPIIMRNNWIDKQKFVKLITEIEEGIKEKVPGIVDTKYYKLSNIQLPNYEGKKEVSKGYSQSRIDYTGVGYTEFTLKKIDGSTSTNNITVSWPQNYVKHYIDKCKDFLNS